MKISIEKVDLDKPYEVDPDTICVVIPGWALVLVSIVLAACMAAIVWRMA